MNQAEYYHIVFSVKNFYDNPPANCIYQELNLFANAVQNPFSLGLSKLTVASELDGGMVGKSWVNIYGWRQWHDPTGV